MPGLFRPVRVKLEWGPERHRLARLDQSFHRIFSIECQRPQRPCSRRRVAPDLVETSDLMPSGNPGATYFGEAAYITPHEYTWCQSHPGECNMFNNFSYRQFSVTGGPTFFNFSAVSSTVRMQPAIQAWADTGATVQQVEPDPGNDGIFFVGYKVTGPNAGMWHYEYAIFNMNLDRAIQSFEVVLPGFPAESE